MKKFVTWTLIAVGVITLFSVFNRKAATLDLSEAFFRYKFKNNFSGAQQNAEAYFLQIKEKDPPPELLARFKGHSPPVKKGSEFVNGSDKLNGILFKIDSYKWYGNIVVINGGYYEGNLSASWTDYIWIQIAGKWILMFALPGVIA